MIESAIVASFIDRDRPPLNTERMHLLLHVVSDLVRRMYLAGLMYRQTNMKLFYSVHFTETNDADLFQMKLTNVFFGITNYTNNDFKTKCLNVL